MRNDTPSPPFCLFVVNSFKALKACKVMTNLDSILKSGDITLPTKVCPLKAMVFPVVMYGSGVGL